MIIAEFLCSFYGKPFAAYFVLVFVKSWIVEWMFAFMMHWAPSIVVHRYILASISFILYSKIKLVFLSIVLGKKSYFDIFL